MSPRIAIAWVLVAGMLLATSLRVAAADAPGPDDTARFLAGMPPGAGSPLRELARDPYAQRHASAFDAAFDNLERQQLGKIRKWSGLRLKASRPTMFYFFGGPDFLYADAFFPNAATYVLSGLESVGQVPDLTGLPPDVVAKALDNLELSLSSFLTASYFITEKMDTDLNNGPVNGILPLLYVFLARSGKIIDNVSVADLDSDGNVQSNNGRHGRSAAHGVKIAFTGADGRPRILYYFSANVADDSISNHALQQFCRRLGLADSLLKSASYVLQESKFSQIREFILRYSGLILQDDSGIPVTGFDARQWQLSPFGRYNRPYGIFEKYTQPKLAELFQHRRPDPLDFGIGYQARFDGSNLLLATKNAPAVDLTRRDPSSAALH
jgi:hypothetical protein